MRTLALAVTVSAVISAGCRDQQPVQPTAGAAPEFMISDGAHNGNAHFFFLPPLAPDPGALFHAGTFNSKLAPVVEVCILTGDPSSGSSVDCMMSGGAPVLVFGPAPMALDATGQQYARNWDTKSPTLLDPSKFYRILVRGARAGTALGFLDVDPVDQGMKNARTGEVVQFQDGRTLPINVRIEDGAFGSTNPDHVEVVVADVATTVTTNTGFAGASFPDGWLPQAARDAGINQVVLIIERIPVGPGTNEPTCLQSGLLEREGCYRFRTDPDLHAFGPFSQLVTAGVCFESPDLIGTPNGPPLGLHRRVEVEGAPAGPTIDLAEVAAPFLTCTSFGPTPPSIGTIKSGSVLDLASLGWHALVRGIGRLVTPDALHAIDLGAGGSTDGFSRIGWARQVTMTKVGGTDGNSAIAGTTLTPDPAVCLVLLHHGVSSPLGNAPVTFSVITGAGTVGGGNNVTVNTGTDGCAHAPWVLGTTPGPNTLTAAALASSSPLTFTAIGVAFTALEAEAGERQSCAIATNGVTYCWGSDARGQLGDGGTVDRFVPGGVSGGLSFATISSSFEHTCGLASGGAAYCWGNNLNGQLGDGTTTNRSTPVAVASALTFAAVTSGGIHTCALTTNGAAYCWGDNSRGQLGTGNNVSSGTPVAVSGAMAFASISAGFFHTCGLTAAGAAFCWGLGGLGNATSTVPVAVSGGLTFVAVTSGSLYTCALTAAGAAYCWGNNASGQLGSGPATLTTVALPTPVSGGVSFVSLSADNQNDIFDHTCGITAQGVAYCWGENVAGELGAPTSEMCPGFFATNPPHACATAPIAVSGGLLFTKIAAGIDHTCGISRSGQMYCWGGNANGQLGNGTTTPSTTPVLVSGPASTL